MTREQLIQALSLMNFELDTHYTIDEDYESIETVGDIDKPDEETLREVFDAWEYRTTLGSRIEALGDISLLIEKYLQGKNISENDYYNLAGFEVERIDTPFGWSFENVVKPNIDILESFVQSRNEDENAEKWEKLRKERNARLTACDWTQLVDSPLSTQAKLDWANYRQALRDLPENTQDPLNPPWPGQP